MMEFSDILIGASQPLHPYPFRETYPCVQFIANKVLRTRTAIGEGGSADGIWEIPGSVQLPPECFSLSLVITANQENRELHFDLAPFNVIDLFGRARNYPGEVHEFRTCGSCSPVQFIMTCSIKVVSEDSSSFKVMPGIENTTQNTTLHFISQLQRSGSAEDIDNAITIARETIEFTQKGHPIEGRIFDELGRMLHLRYQRMGRVIDIEDAIVALQQVVKVTPDHHAYKPSRLFQLYSATHARYKRFGNIVDLQDAISAQEKAIELMPGNNPDKPRFFDSIGRLLLMRFQSLGTVEDLETAISYLKKADELTGDYHPEKTRYTNNLGNAFWIRFERFGSLEDMERAIESLQKTVRLTPDNAPTKSGCLGNLGGVLLARFDRFGDLKDLEGGISMIQKSVHLTPDDNSDKPSRMNNLGTAFNKRFERLGSLEDLGNAILYCQKSVQATADNNPEAPGRLNNLRCHLKSRFDRLGTIEDLEGAIVSQKKAVLLTPDDHPVLPVLLCNLGEVLMSRCVHLKDIKDLESATTHLLKGVQLTPDNNPSKPTQLALLSHSLLNRSRHFKSNEDLDSAVSHIRKAVQLLPEDHPRRPSFLSILAMSTFERFEQRGDVEDLEAALKGQKTAALLMPDGHPDKVRCLFDLGNQFHVRFQRFKDREDLDSAVSNFEKAANSPTGPPRLRFSAALRWAECAEAASLSSLPAWKDAIGLLSRIAWLGLPVKDQHTLVAGVGGAVRDAVDVAIRHQEYETAVEWAEQGRSIVWQNLLSLRTPLDNLREDHPYLANRLRDISLQLEAPPSLDIPQEETQTASIGNIAHQYSQLAIEWDKTVEEIRRIPAYRSFLLPKTFGELARVASEGPVVILNDHKSRCNALVLIPDDSGIENASVINIPLEGFTSSSSNKLLVDMKKLLSAARVRGPDIRKSGRVKYTNDKGSSFEEILREIWIHVAKPVIDNLAYQNDPSDPPRVWWCATGSLAFLPIHAAGLYGAEEIGEKLSDYVISSYTPTLTALLDQSQPLIEQDFQILTVAESSISSPIPQTEEEVKRIRNLAGNLNVAFLMNENATVELVLKEIKNSHWIHLACHGQQRLDDPMKSGFLLHGEKILTLSEIIRLDLPKADFAFLSACQTAMGDEKVAEESVHLAAGMLFSGCRGVIATMWSIQDDDAPKVAESVYGHILKDGRPNRKGAALALHNAVERLRKENGRGFLSWVPFIHIGR